MRRLLIVSAVVSSCLLSPVSADSCMNATYRDPDTLAVRAAYDLLGQSLPVEAAGSAWNSAMQHAAPTGSRVDAAARRAVAVAIARTDGALTLPGLSSSPSKQLHWAYSELKRSKAVASDPVARSFLAEVQERLPAREVWDDHDRHAEAYATLRELADADLLGSGEGYAALARLQLELGDRAAADASLARCRIMTKRPDEVCGAPTLVGKR